MSLQEALDACIGLSLKDLYRVQFIVGQKIEREKQSLINSVTAQREMDGIEGSHRRRMLPPAGGVYLKHPVNGIYWASRTAYKGRWRMWKMIPGQCGLKRGPVVVEEHVGGTNDDLDSLKMHVALGYYKDLV